MRAGGVRGWRQPPAKAGGRGAVRRPEETAGGAEVPDTGVPRGLVYHAMESGTISYSKNCVPKIRASDTYSVKTPKIGKRDSKFCSR